MSIPMQSTGAGQTFLAERPDYRALSGRFGEIYGEGQTESRDPGAGWAELLEWPVFTGA
jgi:hypothetical protein